MMTTLFFQPQWSEFDSFFRQIDEILEGATRPVQRSAKTSTKPATALAWKPRAAVRNLNDRYEIQFQLPGIDPSQLDIEASRDSIVIKGDRKSPEENTAVHSEFRYGRFERHFRLPEEIEHQSVAANYEQGILTLQLPKLSAAEDYRVKVAITATDAANETANDAATDAAIDAAIDTGNHAKCEPSAEQPSEVSEPSGLDSVW